MRRAGDADGLRVTWPGRARCARRALLAAVAAIAVATGAPAAAQTTTTLPPATDPTTNAANDAEATGAPPGTILAPAGADEAGRQQALTELRAAERALKQVVTRQRKAAKALPSLQRRAGAAEADVARLTAADRAAAEQLAAARERVRRLAVAGYVEGGEVPHVDYLLRSGDTTDLSRRTSLVQQATEAKAAALDGYQAALDATSSELAVALAARDSVTAELRQAQNEVRVADADVAVAKAAVDHHRKLLDVITAAAPVGQSDIPRLFLDAYRRAADTLAKRNARCRVGWTAVAALGRIEANHGRYGGGRLALNGDVYPRIVGIPLDGTNGTRVIKDTDKGALDGDTTYDHAVGPMQFIPSTWARIAQDGNGDHRADPNNTYDAALTTATYLCRAVPAGGLDKEDALRRAFFSYNHSNAYVEAAVGVMRGYDSIAPTL